MKKKIYFNIIIILLAFSTLFQINSVSAQEKVIIYAASSTNNVITEISKLYESKTGIKVLTSFASSSTLARQISLGSKADIYLSANKKWFHFLEIYNKADKNHTKDLFSNTLVLISPINSNFNKNNILIKKDFNISDSFKGKLCIGDYRHVPAGMYAKEALDKLNWWENINNRIVGTMDVRSTLNFVERGECEIGIVYNTDAILSKKVKILGEFPKNLHSNIIYPVSLINVSNKKAKDFYTFLSSNEAKKIYKKYGFIIKGK